MKDLTTILDEYLEVAERQLAEYRKEQLDNCTAEILAGLAGLTPNKDK